MSENDRDTLARVADALGKTPEQVETMTVEQLREATVHLSFLTFALTVAAGHDRAEGVHLMEDGIEEQADRAVKALQRFHKHTPLYPVRDQDAHVNLWGFGRAPVHYIAHDADGRMTEQYVLLSELAEQLAVPLGRAHTWLQREKDDALRAQRERDEERGTLGWDLLGDVCDLDLWLSVDDPEAKPDASGQCWSSAGDALVAADRILSFMTVSPWNREFLDNSSAMWGHAFRHAFGDKMADSPALDLLGDTEGLTEAEAAKRANRGPSGPLAAD